MAVEMLLPPAVLSVGIFILDLFTPLGWADGFLYALPLVLVFTWSSHHHYLFGFAALCTGLLILGWIFSPPGGTAGQVTYNRALGMAFLWATALFLWSRTRVECALYLTQEALERRVEERTAALQQAINSLEKDVSVRKRAEEALARMAAIVESSDDAIFSKSMDGIVVSWNGGAERLFGYPAKEVIGKPIEFLIPSNLIDEERKIRQYVSDGKQIDHFETVRRRKDGHAVNASLTISPIKDAAGKIVGVSTIARDISARIQAREELQEREHRMRLFMHATNDCLWDWDMASGRVERSGFDRAFGYAAEEVVSTIAWWEQRLHPDDRKKVMSSFRDTVAKGTASCAYEYRFRRRDGAYAVIADRAYIVYDSAGKAVRALGSMTDVSERVRAEGKIKSAYAQLIELTIRLDSAQEEDRMNISREIHDELGQSLTALKLDLAWLQKRLSQTAEPVPRASLLDKLLSMSALLDSTKQSVRKIATSLRPRVLDDLGLVAALKSQAHEFQAHAGVRCDVDIAPQLMEMPIDSARSTALFRVAQELLTNVMRHARASRVRIEFTEEAGMLILQVRDNGRGIAEGNTADAASLGLVGIRERVMRLGGDFTITGAPGQGTVAIARIPLLPLPC